MDETAKLERIELLRQRCRELGERCTVQRLEILKAVLDLDDHPTAERVFGVVSAAIPGIAKPTAYRTLEFLSRIGVISKACHPGRSTRYDRRIDVHHHLVCLSCNKFVDFENEVLNRIAIPDTSDLGFEVADFRVQLRGICSECRKQQQREEEL